MPLQKLSDMKSNFTVKKKLINVMDNCEPFKFKNRSSYAEWTVIKKEKGKVQINSKLGKNDIKKGSLIVFVTP